MVADVVADSRKVTEGFVLFECVASNTGWQLSVGTRKCYHMLVRIWSGIVEPGCIHVYPLQMLVTFVLVSLLAFFSLPVPPFALTVV